MKQLLTQTASIFAQQAGKTKSARRGWRFLHCIYDVKLWWIFRSTASLLLALGTSHQSAAIVLFISDIAIGFGSTSGRQAHAEIRHQYLSTYVAPPAP